MRVKYLEDLHIPGLGEWSPEAGGDWLHPLHGPLPDHLGLLECEGREFMAAVWETRRSLYVMVEMLEDEDPDPLVPMRELDDVYSMRGWIVQTYRWAITPDGITRGRHTILPETYREDEEWRREIYRMVLEKSVLLCANFPEE